MKGLYAVILLAAFAVISFVACDNRTDGMAPVGGGTPAAAVTIGVTGTSYLTTSATINHGQSVMWDSSNTGHPLYVDNGTICSVNGNSTFPFTFTFSVAGTYHFHCGIHGACSPSNSSCPPTSCAAMAGTLTVN